MRNYRALLTSFIQVVTFLFTCFSGFLRHIAPPDQTGAGYPIGILSFLALLVLLFVSALARGAPGSKYRRAWILAGACALVLAIPPAFLYPRAIEMYTWSYPPEKPVQRIRGLDSDFSPLVKTYLREHPGESSDPQNLARKVENLSDLWTPESLVNARTRLMVLYAWLVLSLAAAVFCLLEGNAIAPARRGAGSGRPKTQLSGG